MDMPPFHRRLLEIALEVTDSYGFALAGGYAMRAHGVVDRPSRDLDFVTVTAPSISDAVEAMAGHYDDSGLRVKITRGTPLLGRLIVTDSDLETSCAVDLMKLPLQRPPVVIGSVSVASLGLALRLEEATSDDVDVYMAYGLSEIEAQRVRLFALESHEDLAMRLLEGVLEFD